MATKERNKEFWPPYWVFLAVAGLFQFVAVLPGTLPDAVLGQMAAVLLVVAVIDGFRRRPDTGAVCLGCLAAQIGLLYFNHAAWAFLATAVTSWAVILIPQRIDNLHAQKRHLHSVSPPDEF